jgi:hypothetical protein
MKENSEMELQLSEEQLHTITGGTGENCAQCAGKHILLNALYARISIDQDLARAAQEKGQWETASKHIGYAESDLAQSQKVLDQINSHNHNTPPTMVPGSEPLAKRQRIR